jgi:hypothetical protein
MTGCTLNDRWKFGFDSMQSQEICLEPATSMSAVGPTQSSAQWVQFYTGAFKTSRMRSQRTLCLPFVANVNIAFFTPNDVCTQLPGKFLPCTSYSCVSHHPVFLRFFVRSRISCSLYSVTGPRVVQPRNRCPIPGRGKRYFTSLTRPYRFWVPPGLLTQWLPGTLSPGSKAAEG